VLASDAESVEQFLAGVSGRQAAVRLPAAATALASNITLQVTVGNWLASGSSTAIVTTIRVAANVP